MTLYSPKDMQTYVFIVGLGSALKQLCTENAQHLDLLPKNIKPKKEKEEKNLL